MPSGTRYSIRANPSGGRYCVWDAEKNAIASSPDGTQQCADLYLQEAFDLIDQLVERADKIPE
jgi:hypothetical protein